MSTALLTQQLAQFQQAQRAFQQNPTPALSTVIKRLHGAIRRNPQHKEMLMTTKLHDALDAYRKALLDTAAGDLMARKAGGPLPSPVQAAHAAAMARKDVLDAARNLSAERFTAELMAANFLGA